MDRRRAIIIAGAIALLAICYARTLAGMFHQWATDEDMSHGFAVPLVMLFIGWRERKRWRNLRAQPNAWGLAILAAAAAAQVVATLGAGLFAGSFAFLISIVGLIVCLGGFAFVRAWALPLILGLFMLPKLAIVYNQATLPMQLLASRMAAGILTAGGWGVIREGNILDVGGHRVLVAEACSGIRYLLPLGFMAVLIAYFSDRRVWMRAATALAAIPLAVVANAVRVAAASALPALAEGPAHLVAGLAIFSGCLGLLMLFCQWVSRGAGGAHA